jgi:hypothetical protein
VEWSVENCIDELASLILTGKGHIIIRKSIWGLSANDLINPTKIAEIAGLDKRIISKIDTPISFPFAAKGLVQF